MAYSKILMAIDSSEYSFASAERGFELAHQLNAKVALIFVIDAARTIHSADSGILPEETIVVLKKEAEQTLNQISKMFNGEDLTKFMPEGHPAEDIIKTAEVWGADLIIMGTYGRAGLMHLLSGSVAESVIRNSKIPVMVVPSK
ncbi:MAG TPA: universal stress protein [Chryseolinea sp.]|nr:universal stress protein [Chryseolinea sp.]